MTYQIRGTDAPIIMGASQYKNAYQLWLEKTGRAEREDISGKRSVKSGIMFEMPILKEYLAEIGVEYNPINDNVKLSNQWQSGTPDYLLPDAVIEIKTAEVYRLKDWVEGVPDYYKWQGVHYMIMTGLKRCVFVAYIGMSNRIIHEIEYNQDEAEALIQAEKAFLQCLIDDVPPATIDLETPEFSQELTMDVDVERLCELYCQVSAQIKELQSQKDDYKNAIIELIGNNTEQIGNRYKASYKPVVKKSLDSKSLSKDYPDIADRYTVSNESYTINIKELKK